MEGKVTLLLFTLALCLVSARVALPAVAPNPVHLGELDEEGLRVQQNFLTSPVELEGGKEHNYEGYHFDEESGNIHYQKGRFTLHPRAVVLDGKRHILSIRCTKKNQIKVETTKKSFADNLEEGALLFFGAGWRSGCHRLHDNGPRGANFFLVTEILNVQDTDDGSYIIKASIEAEDSRKLIKDAEFQVYKGLAESSYSSEEEEEDNQDEEGMTGSQLRKRSLPDHVHSKLNEMSDEYLSQRVVQEFQKRDFAEFLKSIGTAIEKGVATVLEGAVKKGAEAVQALKTAADDASKKAWLLLQNSIKKIFEQPREYSSNPGGWKFEKEHDVKITPFTLKMNFELTPKATIGWTIKDYVLEKFHIGLSAVPTASVVLAWDKSEEITLVSKRIFTVPLGMILIPIPVLPGVSISLSADFAIDFEAKAAAKVGIELFNAKAEGELGFSAAYTKGVSTAPGTWDLKPVTGFKWSITGPRITSFEASLKATLTPSIILGIGANVALLLTASGGPTIGLPISLTLSTKPKETCLIALSWDLKLSLSVGVHLSALGHELLSINSKELKSWSIKAVVQKPQKQNPALKKEVEKDFWCLVKAPKVVAAINKASQEKTVSGSSGSLKEAPKVAKKVKK